MKTYKVTVDKNHTIRWYNKENKLHREDGPAVEYANGRKYWWLNGKLHREDGPAAEYTNGYKSWHLNGELHREDGPAIEFHNSNKLWYLHGKEYSEVDYLREVSKPDCTKQTITIDGKDYILVPK